MLPFLLWEQSMEIWFIVVELLSRSLRALDAPRKGCVFVCDFFVGNSLVM